MDSRQDKIIEILKNKKSVQIDSLCEMLAYSHSTIRRDIIALQGMGLVKREKGNVCLLVSTSKEKHFKLRNRENIEQKALIKELATDFIADGMSIFLDASSTSLQICQVLPRYKNITVVTNGIEVAYYLINHSEVEVFMAGGYVREGASAIVGEPAVEYIKQFNLDVCFVSCNGLDENGFYEPSMQQSIVRKLMIEQAETRIIVADSSKFEQKYKFNLAGYHEVDYLLTDCKPPERICLAAQQSNCEIVFPMSDKEG